MADAGGEDLLSLLPDDVLGEILLRLSSAGAAAQTSVLSHNWHRIWSELPDLKFHLVNLANVRSVIAAYAAMTLRYLDITTRRAAPELVEVVLFLSAPLLIGEIFIQNVKLCDAEEGEEDRRSDAFELPCFNRATKIHLNLPFLGLKLPTSGVFLKLISLYLHNMWIDGWCDLGEVVSSARCPLLQDLQIYNIHGLTNLTIHSKSLLDIELHSLEGLQKITIVAPMLLVLDLQCCFVGRAVIDISAPSLKSLSWYVDYDPTLTKLGEMAHVTSLCTSLVVYGPPGSPNNSESVKLFQHFRAISSLELYLTQPDIIDNCQYLMKEITMLPDTKTLSLWLSPDGHVFGPYVFYLLCLSTGIRNLKLELSRNSEEQKTCSSGCICNQQEDMETDDILLNSLTEVEITGLSGTEHEFIFVERLLRWAAMLKTITLSFHHAITVTGEVCEKLLGLSHPMTCMKINYYVNGDEVMYSPAG